MKKSLLFIICTLISFIPSRLKAAVFNIANGDVAALIVAINTANANSEADIINLASNGVYNLTTVNNTIMNPNIGGGNGLPAIINSFAGTGADLTINGNGATIQRNMAGDLRLLVISGSDTEVVINNVVFKNAKATLNGACIAAMWQKVKLTINDCAFENNVLTPTGANTEDGGGAILIHEGFLTVTNSTFRGNSAPNGGAIKCLLSNMALTNCTFENNATTGTGNNGGAGIIVDGAFNDFLNQNTYNPPRTISVQSCKFLNNTDIKQGGGLFLYTYGITTATIDKCYFKGNTSPMGGGLWAMGETGGTCNITNTTFDANISSGAGGGIATIANTGQTFNLTITNSTLAFNQANGVGAGGGGGLFNANATVTISSSTIAKNATNSFGGGIAGANSISIKNSIIAENTATNNNGAFGVSNIQRNCGSGGFVVSPPPYFTDAGNNLEWPTRTDLTNNGLCTTGISVADPQLDNAIKDNGGSVPTLAILTGSAAINAGNTCTTTDQRGVARVGACDIGAFEFGAAVCNLVVSSNADAGANTLREAISCATSGQIITFAPSMANQTIALASTLEIPVNKNLTIDGLAAPNLSISGNNAVRVFLLKSTSAQPTSLSLKNLKIINARTNEYGGGVKSEHQGTINLENCTFNNNRADDGGSAVFSAFEGYLSILNCNFDGNISIANNTERGSTVMIWGPYAQTIKNSNFTNNKGINGAAINGLNAGLLIEDCNFTGNLTTDARFDTGQPNDFLRGFGGAIYTDRATAGPPSVVLGSIILRRCKFENNIGNGEGGACYLYTDETDNVLVEECYFNNNESRILTGGTNGGSGGAIQHMNNAKNRGFVVKNTTFSNNKAAVVGGAIRADWADTEITNCTFDNNKALLTDMSGFAANGGALVFFSMDNSFVDITNCTLANNYAGWVGGAIASSHPARTRIKNNIFFQNTAGNGGNGWNIQQHSSAEMLDLGNNLQFPAKLTSNWNDYNVSASVTIANPLLNTIANNGGFSPTMSLQATSPAINAGAGCPPTDQRGNTRIGACDIGAFEFGGIITPTITVSTATLTGFITTTGTASIAQTYNLKGANLTTDITVTAPADYEVSLDGTTFANIVTALMANVQTMAGQTISVRIKGSAAVGSPAGDITNVSTGAVTKNVTLTGTVGIAGDIIYVRTDGNDSNNGYTNTPAGAKITLQGGFSAVNDGGTVVWNTGTYNETATLTNKSITLQSVGNPTVQSIVLNGTGKTVTLTGGVNIAKLVDMQAGTLISNGNLTLLSTATEQAMVVNSSGIITGNVKVQRYVSTYPDRTTVQGYNYFSSPVSGKTIAEFHDNVALVLNPAYDFFTAYSGAFPNFYKYNENRLTATHDAFEKGWESPASLAENAEVGRGYILNLSANTLVDFSGTLNNEAIDIPISKGSFTHSGWNLVGNPYPSALDWDLVYGFGMNSTKAASTILRRIATGTYSGTWASYDALVGSGLNGGTKDIALGQGFLVKKTSTGNDNLNLTNAMRNTNPSQFFRTEDAESKTQGIVKVKLTAGKWADETLVYFKREASEKYEEGLDVLKTHINSHPAPNFYTSVGGKKIAFNAQSIEKLPKEIPLHFSVASSGQHEISLSELRNFKENTPIYLEDKKLKITQDLREKAYTFSANAGTDTTRFVLKFDAAFATELPDESLTIYPNPVSNELKIKIDSKYKGKLQIRLTDLLGREVIMQTHEKQFTQEEIKIDLSQLKKGVYLVEVGELPLGTKAISAKIVKE